MNNLIGFNYDRISGICSVKWWFFALLVAGTILGIIMLILHFFSGMTATSDLIYGPISSGANLRHAQIRDDGYATGNTWDCTKCNTTQGFLGGKEPPVFYNIGNITDATGRMSGEGAAATAAARRQAFEPYTNRFEAFNSGTDQFAERQLGLPKM